MARPLLRISQEPFDFTGYVLFDEMDHPLEPDYVWDHLPLDPSTVEKRRCVAYTNLNVTKTCAIVKFRDEKIAQEVIQRCRLKEVPLDGICGLHVSDGLKALFDAEEVLSSSVMVRWNLFRDKVRVENVKSEERDRIISTMSRFGEMHASRDDEMNVIPGCVCFKYYSSALASHIAYHGTVRKGQEVSVVPYANRDEVTNLLIKKAKYLVSPPQNTTLVKALLTTSFSYSPFRHI